MQISLTPDQRLQLSHEELLNVLHYDPNTGIFTWKVDLYKTKIKRGMIAGSTGNKGYVTIRYKRIDYQANRLAWFYVTGKWPTKKLDHKDLFPSNNRFNNLREATNSQNQFNKLRNKNNLSGFKGVSWHKASGKWVATIKINGKQKHLGLKNTPEEASALYEAAASEVAGEFYRKEQSLKIGADMEINLTTDQQFRLTAENHEVVVPATVVGLRFIVQMLQGQQLKQTKLGESGAPTQFEIDKAVKEWQDKIWQPPLIDCEVDL